MTDLDRIAAAAIDRHERLLHLKVMELLLGSMVQRAGVDEVRALLLRYADDLAEFSSGDRKPCP